MHDHRRHGLVAIPVIGPIWVEFTHGFAYSTTNRIDFAIVGHDQAVVDIGQQLGRRI